MAQQTPPGWYPDPSGSGQQRYWDGTQWTQHLNPGQGQAPQQQQHQAAHGQAAQQPQQAQYGQGVQQQQQQQQQYGHQAQAQVPQAYGQAPQQRREPGKLEKFAELDVDSGHDAARIQNQVQQAGTGTAGGGGGTIFSEPILVVNQKAKLIEVNNEYSVFDQNGQQLASVVQVGQSAIKKAIRFLGKYDQYMTHKLEIRDGHGRVLMQVTRPAKLLKSRVIVERGDGMPLGEIVQQNVMGKKTFSMMANGQEIGQIRGEDWFSFELGLFDNANNPIARITKTWEGFGKAIFTTADNYVLQIHRQLQEPLLSMVVASALTVDLAIHQDAK